MAVTPAHSKRNVSSSTVIQQKRRQDCMETAFNPWLVPLDEWPTMKVGSLRNWKVEYVTQLYRMHSRNFSYVATCYFTQKNEFNFKDGKVKKKIKLSLYRPCSVTGFARRGGYHIFRQSAHRWRQGCQPYEPAAFFFLPRGKFFVLISTRDWVDPMTIVRLEGLLRKLKKSISFGTRTGDLPACSIVPKPATLQRAPVSRMM
jgi:hypothetical protein